MRLDVFLQGELKRTSRTRTQVIIGNSAYDIRGKRLRANHRVRAEEHVLLWRPPWDEEPVPFNTVYGATHGMDVPFMFHNFGTNVFSFAFSSANAPGREALSDAMVGSLAAFARTGDPNHAGLGVTWPNWPDQIVFDASPTQAQITVE